VSCQVNTAAFNATTGVASFANGSRVLSARAILASGSQVATPSTPLLFNNTSGIVATLTNDNAPDPNTANHPGNGLQWWGGSATLRLVGVSYVSGTTVASVSCTIFGKDAFNFTLNNGVATQVYAGGSTWSSTDKDLNGYLTPPASALTGESISCPTAALSNGDPMIVVGGSTLLNFGAFPGQQTNAAQPALQFFRVDNVAPGAASANGVAQGALALSAPTSPWVNSTTSFAVGATSTNAVGVPAASVLNAASPGLDIEEGVDAIVVTVNVPPAGGTLPTGTGCPLTGLTAVTTGSQLAETTVSSAYPMRITFTDALGNRTCLDQTGANSIGADFVAPTIVSVTGPAANSFFTSQAAVTDFSFSVTDNASGFGATPIRVSMVRLDSANAAFCVIGGTSCATTNAALAFDATNSLTNSGYYTITYAVRDQAGNTTGTTSVTYLLDQVAPTWAGGVSLPSVIAGAATNTFTATPSDNLDLASVFGLVDYPTMDIRYPSQTLGSYGGPLEMGGARLATQSRTGSVA